MDLHDSKAYTRRAFLARGITLASGAVTIPYFLQKSGVVLAQSSMMNPTGAGVPTDRILVVVQLAGGNDGLNTVIPFAMDEYYRERAGMSIGRNEALRLYEQRDLGLHPALTGLKSLFDDGMLTVVQGVGYPNPNRSHFTSTDIWQTADPRGTGEGWLGRYFDNQCAGSPDADAGAGLAGHAGVSIGRDAPLAMQGRLYQPVSFESEELFRWSGSEMDPAMAEAYDEIMKGELDSSVDESNPTAAFLTRTAMDARIASDRIIGAVRASSGGNYPRTGLGRQLAMIASMIRAGLETRVYYATLGGFDTHAGQGGVQGQHANLLRQLGDAMRAFYTDLKEQGNDGRVLSMTFSEFGRRVKRNASNGTDHGAAAPLFLMGPMVRAGIHGDHSSLTDLDDGDLKYHTDFRRVYATVLEEWLKADSRAVLGGRFAPIRVMKQA